MVWLQGGPFLEVAFILPFEAAREFPTKILAGLRASDCGFEVAVSQAELQQLMEDFDRGSAVDPADPGSVIHHAVQVPAYATIVGRRKCVLYLSNVSPDYALVSIWFYGSEFDEEDQIGIRPNDLGAFKSLLTELHGIFRFPLGTVGYEVHPLYLFESASSWPDESYDLKQLDIDRISHQVTKLFVRILVDQSISGDRTMARWQSIKNGWTQDLSTLA